MVFLRWKLARSCSAQATPSRSLAAVSTAKDGTRVFRMSESDFLGNMGEGRTLTLSV